MPLIEVDDDTLNFLLECKKELNTQDNRATRNVIFFNEYPERHYAEYGDDYHSDGYVWLNPDHTQVCDDEELVDYILDTLDDNVLDILKKWHSLSFYDDPYNAEEPYDEPTTTLKDWLLKGIKENSYESNLYEIIRELINSIINDEESEEDCRKLEIEFSEYSKLNYSESMTINESGLFSFFENDIQAHKELDGHNYHRGEHSYGGSIQRTPMMLKLRDILMKTEWRAV